MEYINELRVNNAAELRATPEEVDRPSTISGYAAVFGQLSDDLGGFRERIRPGAFAETIEADDIRALWNHDANYVLGRTANGTLILTEDDRGLRFTVTPPDTSWARDALTTIARGDVDQMSFGFRTPDGGDSWTSESGQAIRELVRVELFDVSPVTYPAYPQTSAEARSKASSLSAPDPDPAIKTNQDPAGEAADQDPPAPGDAQARETLRRWRLQLAEQEEF